MKFAKYASPHKPSLHWKFSGLHIFLRELEQDLVPEWRAKYLNYKVGIARWGLNSANSSSSLARRRSRLLLEHSALSIRRRNLLGAVMLMSSPRRVLIVPLDLTRPSRPMLSAMLAHLPILETGQESHCAMQLPWEAPRGRSPSGKRARLCS